MDPNFVRDRPSLSGPFEGQGIVVMTGATAGIGQLAAQRINCTTRARLIVGARGAQPRWGEAFKLDLASFASVRSFAATVEKEIAGAKIDVLILNAALGTAPAGAATEDGFEATFAVNHLAHYLLLRLLMPLLATGARVVITTSNTHDPRTSPVPPRHADAIRLAHPETDPERDSSPFTSAFRAYSSSKLCNLLTARALAVSPLAQERKLTVIAFNPGFTPGTGLGRNLPLPLRMAMQIVPWILGRFLRINTAAHGGETLADLALGRIERAEGHLYASIVSRELAWPDPSELAQNDDVMAKLWVDSARLVGARDAP
jgi:NAD(P)-dependent dehydrogenase (short-subunit alcohol dehydrogenase family)